MNLAYDLTDVLNGGLLLWVGYIFVFTFFVIIRWKIVIVSIIIPFLEFYRDGYDPPNLTL